MGEGVIYPYPNRHEQSLGAAFVPLYKGRNKGPPGKCQGKGRSDFVQEEWAGKYRSAPFRAGRFLYATVRRSISAMEYKE